MTDGIELTQEAKQKAEEMLPDYMVGGLFRYFEDRIPPGNFLTALLSNDLMETFGRADDMNGAMIRNYILWLYNYAPGRASGAWGSPEAVHAWLNHDPS